ncbi:MAG TPA: hypothetical protein VLI05_04545 [Candidatus Saccharimonadia bacterium]|nr:hypothetical protein [Candidatus Saccharimonadia bacterium]
MTIFASAEAFQAKFRAGLAATLALPDVTPGQLVLVLANAIMLGDEHLVEQVRLLAEPWLAKIPETMPESAVVEDVQVLRLALLAGDPLALSQRRTTAAGWQIQLNRLRGFRPHRAAGSRATTLHRPFDSAGFSFERVPHEAYAHVDFCGQSVALFFNKYPFEPYHTVVVPDVAGRHPQILRQSDHELAWELQTALAPILPNVATGYNALGTFASVNHLHFQTVISDQNLPLMHLPELSAYPISVRQYHTSAAAWHQIDELQQANQPFNLVYAPGRVIVIPRRFQGSYEQADWVSGFAWYELAGSFIVSDEAQYHRLTDAAILTQLRAATG